MTEKKLSYEELKNIANQLSEQNRVLREEVQKSNYFNVFKRLDYLMQILSLKENFDDEFIKDCVKEVKETISLPKQDDKESK